MAALDFPSSPSTGQIFTGPNGAVWSWDGTKWISATSGNLYSAINNVGRNLVHNSLMSIAQRTLPVTATGYTLDRWRAEAATDTISFSQVALADADRAAIGDEDAVNALQNVFGGTGGAGAYNMVHQRIETPRRLAGDTVTVSFWAKATSGTPKIGISIDQVWNSVATNGTGTAVTLSSGATNNTRAGSIGVQTGPFTVQIWGVQLEIGSTATPLEKLDPVMQLQQCQRFFYVGGFSTGGYAPVNGSGFYTSLALPVTMRAASITIVPTFTTQTNCGSSNISVVSATTLSAATFSTAGSVNITFAGTFTVSADL